MDQPVSLPAQTPSQFLAQLPELAVELLHLSHEFEGSLEARHLQMRLTDSLRGWSALEKLARDSLIERGKQAAAEAAERARAQELEQARSAKPLVPARRLARSFETKTQGAIQEAFQDPRVMSALKQWTQDKNSRD